MNFWHRHFSGTRPDLATQLGLLASNEAGHLFGAASKAGLRLNCSTSSNPKAVVYCTGRVALHAFFKTTDMKELSAQERDTAREALNRDAAELLRTDSEELWSIERAIFLAWPQLDQLLSLPYPEDGSVEDAFGGWILLQAGCSDADPSHRRLFGHMAFDIVSSLRVLLSGSP